MLIIALLILFGIFTTVIWPGRIRIIYIKKLMVILSCIIFILCLIIFSKKGIEHALNGLNLFVGAVLPSLFPFFAASEMLQRTGFVKASGILLEPLMRPLFNVPGCGSFALAMGITSGYPLGAKITANLKEQNMVTQTEAERLLAFTNNSGPLFIVGAVASGMLNVPSAGIFLLICHISACLTVGLIFKYYRYRSSNDNRTRWKGSYRRFKREFAKDMQSAGNFGTIFGETIKNSVISILNIGGFIILFSVIINLMIDTGLIGFAAEIIHQPLKYLGIDKKLVVSVLSGLFELTTGNNMVSAAAGVPFTQKLITISFITGFAGFSVHSQVLSIVSRSGISIKPYLFGKLLQGFIASIYTIAGLQIAGKLFLNIAPAFSTFNHDISSTILYNFRTSVILLFFTVAVFLSFILIAKAVRFARKISRSFL